MSGDHWKITKWFFFHELKPLDFVTSWFVSPLVLFIFRFWATIYSFIVLVTSWALHGEDGWWLAYFTHLTYLSLFIYFLSSTIHSGIFIFSKKPMLLNAQPRILNYIFQLHVETLATYHIVVPVVFWALLSGFFLNSDPRGEETWLTISVHGLDFILTWAEVFLNKIPCFLRHILIVVAIGFLYMFYTWVLHAIPLPVSLPFYPEPNRWVYGFLDWDQGPIAAGFYLGIIIFFILMFFVSYGICRLRDYIGKRAACRTESEFEADKDDGQEMKTKA